MAVWALSSICWPESLGEFLPIEKQTPNSKRRTQSNAAKAPLLLPSTRAEVTGEGVYEVQLTAGKTHYTWAMCRPMHQRQILNAAAPSQQARRKPPVVRTVTLNDNCVNPMAHREPDF